MKTFYRDKITGICWTVIAYEYRPIRTGYRGTIRGYIQLLHWMCLGKIDG